MWQGFIDRTNSFFTRLADALPFAPPWAVSILVLVVATAAAWIIHAVTLAVMARLLRARHPYLLSVLDQTRNPTRLGLLLIAMAIALQSAPLGADTRAFVSRLLGLGVICLIGWIALTALRIAANIYLRRYAMETADNLLARKHVTQVRGGGAGVVSVGGGWRGARGWRVGGAGLLVGVNVTNDIRINVHLYVKI